jgi:CHAT domain-containing protein
MTLYNLGIVLKKLKRLEEAEGAYREALGIYRRLADKEPQVYEPDVAMTLNNLGGVLDDLRRFKEAEGAYREALEIYRRLAKFEPQSYESKVKIVLHNLSELRINEQDAHELVGCMFIFVIVAVIVTLPIFALAASLIWLFYRYPILIVVFFLAMCLLAVIELLLIMRYDRHSFNVIWQGIRLKMGHYFADVFEFELWKVVVLLIFSPIAFFLYVHLEQPIIKWTAIYVALILTATLVRKVLPSDKIKIKASRLKALRMLAGEMRSIIDNNHPIKDHPFLIALCLLVAPFLLVNPSAVRTLAPFLIKRIHRLPELFSNLGILLQPSQAMEELVNIQESLSEEKYPVLWLIFTQILSYFLIYFPQNEPVESIEQAISCLLKVQRRYHDLGLFEWELKTKVALAKALLRRVRGSKQENCKQAIQLLEEALPLLEKTYSGAGLDTVVYNRVNILRTLADAYRNYGDIPRAIELYSEALSLLPPSWRANPYFLFLPKTYSHYVPTLLGYADALLHADRDEEQNVEQAIRCLNEALETPEISDPEEEDFVAWLRRRQFLEIQLCIGQAYQKRVVGDPRDNLQRAESAFRLVAQKAPGWGVPLIAQQALLHLGNLLFDQGRYDEATEVFREAIDWVEQVRMKALTLERRAEILRENVQLFERIIICLMKTHRYREALEYAERGKSRTLIDLLTLRDLRPQNVPSEIMNEYERLLFEARSLEDQLRLMEGGEQWLGEWLMENWGVPTQVMQQWKQWTKEHYDQLRQQLDQKYTDLRRIIDIVRQHDPDFLPHVKPLTADEIIALARDADATLVLFRVTEAGSFVFLVFPDGETDVVEVPDFTTAALNELLVKFEDGKASDGWVVRYYRYQVALAEGNPAEALHARQSWLGKMDETLGTLYQRLLKPVHERLKGWQRRALPADHPPHLVLVPNRGLAILPLHACWWEEDGVRKYLLDEFVIRYAPSLSVFKRCLERERAGRKRETLLGVANPVPPGNLVFSEWECEEIERLIGNERCLMLWREKATEAEVRQWMRERNYLHFSCHGQYRLDAPLESSLRLAGEDTLTLGEILEGVYLPRAWLVVLSACETGLVDFREVADEHFGLPTGFLYAGVPTVYGSLWSVNDLSTALLMVKVYEGLEREGKSKPEALRDAQIWLRDLTAREALTLVRRKEAELSGERMAWADVAPLRRALEWSDPNDCPFAHPYHWAGFQCVGV